MVFSAPIFLFFFLPVVLLLHAVSKGTLRNIILLLASLFFYAWGEIHYTLVMLFSMASAYAIGRLIGKSPHKKSWLTIGLIIHVGLLGYFKYFNFLAYNLVQLTGVHYEFEEVHLPIGISFFTFQIISYLVDVYRSDVPAERNPLHLGLYISLFPQLIAGPIVRYTDVIDDMKNRKASVSDWTNGVQRFIIGFAKKVVIANPLGLLAQHVRELPPEDVGTGLAWIGILAYSLQILFDFSGYSDMAIGIGKMFGFRFPENFNYPYIAKSIREFWRRWHMTLSNWFKDYLYIPLGGNRSSKLITYRNLIIVFFLTGLWHGASWNFVIWGLFHGAFMIVERLLPTRNTSGFIAKILSHCYTLLVVVIGWVFFSLDTLGNAIQYLGTMFSFSNGIYALAEFIQPREILIFLAGILLCLPPGKFSISSKPVTKAVGFALLLLLFGWSCAEMIVSTYNPFIYFRF